MRLLVTGGSGFLGGYVLREAARRGHETVALARSADAASTVAARGAQPITGDLDAVGLLSVTFAAARCDALVNLASLGFGHGPAIVAAAEETGISRAIFVSTTAVTTTLAAPTKRVRLGAEERIRSSGLDWTILRPTMIYGAPGDRNLSRLLVLLTRIPILPVPGGGTHLQQPVHVADLADAVLAAAERPGTAGSCYDIAGPQPQAFGELLAISARAVASKTRFIPVPLAPVIAVARGYEKLCRHPRIRAEQLQRLAEDKAFEIEDAMHELDFGPRTFASGIRAEAQALGLAR
ncbi:MAG TPA: NAD(P)H-binding protein [Streptosporangiaceae bacterium]|nr:NAD(P)H-binding protein [Streptosporangiaceae bacterium]